MVIMYNILTIISSCKNIHKISFTFTYHSLSPNEIQVSKPYISTDSISTLVFQNTTTSSSASSSAHSSSTSTPLLFPIPPLTLAWSESWPLAWVLELVKEVVSPSIVSISTSSCSASFLRRRISASSSYRWARRVNNHEREPKTSDKLIQYQTHLLVPHIPRSRQPPRTHQQTLPISQHSDCAIWVCFLGWWLKLLMLWKDATIDDH